MNKIAIEDMKKRGAIVSFRSTTSVRKKSSSKIRRVKTVPEKGYDKIYRQENGVLKNDEEIFKEFVNSDKEIDFEKTGCEVKHLKQVYLDNKGDFVRDVWYEETIFDRDGNVKSVHPFEKKHKNICDVSTPLKWTGKYIPYEEAAKKFVIKNMYQLCHVDGLTFDFLFDISKDLQENNAIMYMGGGPTGEDPVVFREGGKPYRVFLKGESGFSDEKKCRWFNLYLLVCEMEYVYE